MSFLSYGMQERLKSAFQQQNFSIILQSNHIIVENSQDQTDERIRKIIVESGFYPILSHNKINKNITFTIVPYEIPEFFKIKQISSLTDGIGSKETYFNENEIDFLLKDTVFDEKSEKE